MLKPAFLVIGFYANLYSLVLGVCIRSWVIFFGLAWTRWVGPPHCWPPQNLSTGWGEAYMPGSMQAPAKCTDDMLCTYVRGNLVDSLPYYTYMDLADQVQHGVAIWYVASTTSDGIIRILLMLSNVSFYAFYISARFGARTSSKTSASKWPRICNEIHSPTQAHHKWKSWARCEKCELISIGCSRIVVTVWRCFAV